MIEWKEFKLGDVVSSNNQSITNGYPYKTIQYLDTGSITEGKIEVYQEYNISDAPSRAKRLVKNNDIVYSTVRPIQRHYGFIIDPPKNLVVSTGFSVIETNRAIAEPLFVYYFLISDEIVETLDVIAEGSTSAYPSLKPSDIENIDLILPPLHEQRAIASVLSSLDDKIDLLHHQNKTLEALAETLFRHWFVEEAGEGWEITTLAEHTEVFRGLSYKGSGLSDANTGIPMHNLNSVYEGCGYKYEGIKYYKSDFRDKHVVKSGDIIIANTEQGHEFRLIGFPAVVPNYFGESGIFSQHIYKLSILKNTYLTSQFIYYLIKTPKVREQITGATNGSTVNMLAIDGLQRPEFNLPPIERVKLYSEIIKSYWKKKEDNRLQIRTLTRLRDTLLPKLMSGEVKVTI